MTIDPATLRLSIPCLARPALLLAGLLAANAALAGPARFEPGANACDAGRLRLDQTPLSQALGTLAAELGFELQYQSADDPLVSADWREAPPRLVQKLAQRASTLLQTEPHPRCEGQQRIVKVWVMPEGGEAPVLPAAQRAPTPQEAEQMSIYRRAHGMDEDGKPLPR